MVKLMVISGGQSGVDRAALDAANEQGVAYGGWCPRGGWAEDFPAPPGVKTKYPHLRETPSRDPAQRTEWNMRDADACLILADAGGVAASRGTALAAKLAARYEKPMLLIDLGAPDAVERACNWTGTLTRTCAHATPFRLAIGGPRESEAPGIYAKARALLAAVLNGASA